MPSLSADMDFVQRDATVEGEWKMVTWIRAKLAQLHKDEEGQTIVEYALIIVLIALAVMLASPSLTSAIIQVFSETSSLLMKRPAY